MTDPVLIWSGEHHAWWRPNHAGYTTNIQEAGRYPIDEASAIKHGAGPEKRIVIKPAPETLPDYVPDAATLAWLGLTDVPDPRGFVRAALKSEEIFWLILRAPGCTPVRKGPFLKKDVAATLRVFLLEFPFAYITYLSWSPDHGPSVEDGPAWLAALDGRSRTTAARHRAQSHDAHDAYAQKIQKL